MRQGQVTLLDQPELYIYAYHGMNTWDHYHWARILHRSQSLGAETSVLVTALFNIGTHGAVQLQARLANSIRKCQFFWGRELRPSAANGFQFSGNIADHLFDTAANHLPAIRVPTEPVSSG